MDNLRFSSAPTADSIDASIVQHYPDCEPVAVIGYACHFPESPDGETFWQNLLEGRECSRRFTREELLAVGLDAAIIDDPHYVNIGTVLDNADCFDATLFGYSRQEAESMDPQQRLFLQAVWHALEHAGYAPAPSPIRPRFRLFPDEYLPRSRSIERDRSRAGKRSAISDGQ